MSPAVSVIVTTYNYGHYLAGALISVLRQTLADWEVIIIDDGSTDDTAAVVEPFLADPRVQYLRIEHAGQSAAKNVGLRRARAPLVAFLDADDLWLPDKLERQVALFRADPTLGVVYTRRLLIDEQGRELIFRESKLHRGIVLEAMFRDNFVCFSSAMVRSSVFDAVGLFDESLTLAIDYDLWLRVARQYRFDYVAEPLVKYRTGHANLSRRAEERLLTALGIMERFLKEGGGKEILKRRLVRRAKADVYLSIALNVRRRSRWAALPWYTRALVWSFGAGVAWKGLLSLPFPELMFRTIRRALGRPVDWSVRPLAAPPSGSEERRSESEDRTRKKGDQGLPAGRFPLAAPGQPRAPVMESHLSRHRLLTNVAANWLGFAVQLVVAFFMSPILVHGLGTSRYGIWSLVESVLAYLMLFDLGVAAAVVRYVARFEATQDHDSLNRVFSTSLGIFAGAGAVAMGVALGLAFWCSSLVRIPAEFVEEARWMLVLLGFNLAIGLPLNVFPCLLDGLGRFPAKTAIRTTLLLLRSILFLIVLALKGGLVPLAWAITGCNILEHVALAVTAWWYMPDLRFSLSLIDKATFRTIRSYSVQALLVMVAGRVSFQTDAIVIGAFLAPDYITYFAVAGRLVEYAKNSLRVATTVLTPAVSAMEAQGKNESIRSVLINSTRYVLWIILPIQAGLHLLGKPFLTLWMGSNYVDWSFPTLAILALPLSLYISQSVSGRILYGLGQLRWFTIVVLGEALTNLLLSLALVKPLGIEGVAWGTTIPSLVGNLFLAVHVCRLLGVGLGEYLRRSFLMPLAGAALLAAGWFFLVEWIPPISWASLLLVGIAGLGGYSLIAIFLELGTWKGRQGLRPSARLLYSGRRSAQEIRIP
jgi:O-antigen/teichoic acid export membrane protein/glycosyltransferase involved in cell wall biosynthesis